MWPALHVHVGDTHAVVSTHPLIACLAVLIGVGVAVRRAARPDLVAAVALLVVVATLGGSRALFWLLRGGDPDPLGSGLASMGGLAAALVAIVAASRVARVSAASLLDAFAPAGVLALGVGRVGCFLAGCCYGAPSDVPWAVVFPSVDGQARHPLQLYSALADVVVVALACRRPGPAGAVAARCALGLGLVRFGLETLRDAATTNPLAGGWITLPQVGAVLLVVGGAGALRVTKPQGRGSDASRGSAGGVDDRAAALSGSLRPLPDVRCRS